MDFRVEIKDPAIADLGEIVRPATDAIANREAQS